MDGPEHLSFCRICMGTCGMVLTTDADGRLASIRADRDDPQTLGFACFKGLRAVEAHNSPKRILRPLKRLPDGTRIEIPLEVALDEIADRLGAIRAESGDHALAGYKGGGAFFTASAAVMLNEFLAALGSPKVYSSATIDQSAKAVTAGRMGTWPPGKLPNDRCDVMLLVGTNPMVSVNPPFDCRNPVKRMKQARARGMKLIVIDPRRTETAEFADLHLPVLPGEDVTLLAGILREMLANGWYDRAFCDHHAGDLERLREEVAPFTLDYVAARADLPAASVTEAARLLGGAGLRALAGSSTGPDMGAHSNLAEHLIEAINVLAGAFIREGEEIPNPGAVLPRVPQPAQVIPAGRWWEAGPISRIDGSGSLMGEMMTGTLADEILVPGPGQVRALIVHGGNPASSIPDQHRIVEALRALNLLVCIEPVMSITAELADYVLPPFMQYERPDLHFWLYEWMIYRDAPWARYTPAIARPPEGSELVDDWYVFWALAKRMGVPMTYQGQPLDMGVPPTGDALLERIAAASPMPFEALQAAPRGARVDETVHRAAPAEPGCSGRFSLMPDDVAAELADALAEVPPGSALDCRLAVRRLRETFNSVGRDLPETRKRQPFNRAYIHPDELAERGMAPGDRIRIRSDHGEIVALASADPTLRRRVVSIAHGFGALPGAADDDYQQNGVSTNLLLDGKTRETINAMPRMTGVPVALERIN
ncbi:Anaerobic selenocysteine-containing dehydrogenase [Sphingomonas jatrophae]|uniref:Anaerobic selenocysteine-containing dehydrogenase n=2 Tax=Sphingomonas jatrophae TaxID=1166337 RepID=A0A1I6KFF7_9SPHN|nr:molybdopterin-dependent oxidoreductase [Sphingomonas jatrophae]SFR89982.1 Anaerobic selenocysteine-containing dehydrogenase [Sphingomonas jatrophae]